MIQIQNLSKTFQSRKVLENLNLKIDKNEFFCLLGPSGCGKSTLLRLIAGLESPSQGKVIFPSDWDKKSTSFVFQESQLLNWRNVEENISLPAELLKLQLDHGKIDKLLKMTNLESFKKNFPHQLSGGMKMRTSLARALYPEPKLLLLDEPFAALDENTRFELQDQLLELHFENKMTTVFVTHSMSEAAYLGDRIILLSKHGGSISLDLKLQYAQKRSSNLRTSAELNSYVSQIAELMRASK